MDDFLKSRLSAARLRAKARLRTFATGSDGAASAEFVVVVATAVALSLLVTAQVGFATGALVLETKSKLEQGQTIIASGEAEGCAVEVSTEAGQGGPAIKRC